MSFTLHLMNGDSQLIGHFRINEDATLDAWETVQESPDEWLGLYAAHAWYSVISERGETGEDDSGEVVQFPDRGA